MRIENVDVGLRASPPKASIAAAPVSPEVAPRMVARSPRSVEDTVHRAPEPLHGEVLERQRRPVEQFEREEVRLDLDQRRGRRVAKPGVGVRGHRLELGRAEIAADELGHHAAPRPRRRGAPASARIALRPPFGQRQRRVKAAVAGEPGQERVRKAERRRRPARRNVMHELEILSRFARRLSQKPRKENGSRTYPDEWGQTKTWRGRPSGARNGRKWTCQARRTFPHLWLKGNAAAEGPKNLGGGGHGQDVCDAPRKAGADRKPGGRYGGRRPAQVRRRLRAEARRAPPRPGGGTGAADRSQPVDLGELYMDGRVVVTRGLALRHPRARREKPLDDRGPALGQGDREGSGGFPRAPSAQRPRAREGEHRPPLRSRRADLRPVPRRGQAVFLRLFRASGPGAGGRPDGEEAPYRRQAAASTRASPCSTSAAASAAWRSISPASPERARRPASRCPEEQVAVAQAARAASNFAERLDFRLQDYRDVTGDVRPHRLGRHVRARRRRAIRRIFPATCAACSRTTA